MLKPETKQKECVHHWIIESPNGSTSFGRCKYCGAVKEFSNNWQDMFIKRETPSDDPEALPDI